MENLTPCKVGVCIHHHCPKRVLPAHPAALQIPQTEISLHCWLKSRFLLCSYSSVSKTLSPPHSLTHKTLCLQDIEKGEFPGDICLQRFFPHVLHTGIGYSVLCIQNKPRLRRTTESLSRRRRYFSLTPAAPQDLSKSFGEPRVQTSTGLGRPCPSEPSTPGSAASGTTGARLPRRQPGERTSSPLLPQAHLHGLSITASWQGCPHLH